MRFRHIESGGHDNTAFEAADARRSDHSNPPDAIADNSNPPDDISDNSNPPDDISSFEAGQQ
jgi:hypothetical protein